MNRLFRRGRAAFFCTWIAVANACSTARNDHASPAETPEPSPAATLQARATVGSSRIGDSLVPESGNGGYDVESYDLLLSFDAADQPMRGRATIVASATQDLSAFYLDLHGLTVEQVEVDGAQARFERTGDELLITPTNALADGTRFATTVRYAGIPEGVKDPSAPVDSIGWLASDGEIYVFSQPNGAMSYFPCNDHPKDKALFTIAIDVPRPLEAVANGALVETIEQGERRTFVWKARDLMATYLVTIAIADFEEQELVGPDGLRIVNYFTQSSRERSRTPFARTPAMIEFLSASFGPYPFEIAGNILSNVSIGLALETQTKPVYGRGAGSESTICHELAHQWFGNAVCVEDWDDIWINEGISEYAAWMYLEHTKGREAFEKELVRNYGLARFANATPPGKPEVTEMFGLGMYVRGPLALHSVRAAIGDERFLTLMRTWVAAHLHGNASLEQFLEHVQSQSDASVRATLERWLFDETMPSVPAWDDQVAAEKMKRDAEREARRKAREEEKAKQKEADAQKKDG